MGYDVKTGFTHESPAGGPDEWYTPREIFQALGVEYDMDVCSPGPDVVPWIPAKRHITRQDDGLVVGWSGRVWVNPPYGKSTGMWLDRLSEYRNGIALVMSRTDTLWFHRNIRLADAICFIKGRISFIYPDIAADYAKGLKEPKGNCGAGSVLLAFGDANIEPVINCGLGWAVRPHRGAKHQRTKTLFNP